MWQYGGCLAGPSEASGNRIARFPRMVRGGNGVTRARARYLLRLGRLLPCLVITTALLAVWTDIAHASLFLVFDHTSGRPGTLVHVHTAGEGACLVCPSRMPLYFAGATVSDEITAPDDPRLVEVGALIVDEHGNGSGTITVPGVSSGAYILG